MPVTYEIDKFRPVIRTRCLDYVTFSEVIGHFRELEQDPHCPEQLDVLLDLSRTTSLPTSDQLRAVGREVRRVRDRVRFGTCAIVVGSDALFGTAMVFEVLAAREFKATKIFQDVADAEAWLKAQRTSA